MVTLSQIPEGYGQPYDPSKSPWKDMVKPRPEPSPVLVNKVGSSMPLVIFVALMSAPLIFSKLTSKGGSNA